MAKPSAVRISIPATTSNLGPGFDVLGMALTLRNHLTVRPLPKGSADKIEIFGESAESLPRDKSNLVVRAFRKHRASPEGAFHFKMVNRIPLSRGLGSSAAARLAGLLAAEAFCSAKPDFESLISSAIAMEGHPDNAVAAFFGGLAGAVTGNGGLKTFRLRTPKELSIVLLVPEFEVSTEKARRIMPTRVSLKDAIYTSSRLAMLTAAFEQKRFNLLSEAMQDALHQPYRAKLVAGFHETISAALAVGALGAALSGSGSTILAFARGETVAARVAKAMAEAFSRKKNAGRIFFVKADASGARITVK